MRGDYDYNHATSNAILVVILLSVIILGGLFMGLTLLTSIL